MCVHRLGYISFPRAPFESRVGDEYFRTSRCITCLEGHIIIEEQMVLYWFIQYKLVMIVITGMASVQSTHCWYLVTYSVAGKRKIFKNQSGKWFWHCIFQSFGLLLFFFLLYFSSHKELASSRQRDFKCSYHSNCGEV